MALRIVAKAATITSSPGKAQQLNRDVYEMGAVLRNYIRIWKARPKSYDK